MTTTKSKITIRLFEVPTNEMLPVGTRVAYKGYDGEYAAHRTGIILDRIEQDGRMVFNVEGCAYTNDELRLIVPELIDDFDTLKKEVAVKKSFIPVTERLYYYALEVLPPIYLKNGTFKMGECYSGDLYYTFGEKDGQYYGCLCNANFSLNNF